MASRWTANSDMDYWDAQDRWGDYPVERCWHCTNDVQVGGLRRGPRLCPECWEGAVKASFQAMQRERRERGAA